MAGASAVIRRRLLEHAKPGDHESISLARQRCRQNRVSLRIARQAFCASPIKSCPFRGALRRIDFIIGGPMIAHFRPLGNLNFIAASKPAYNSRRLGPGLVLSFGQDRRCAAGEAHVG